ncbi:MAG: hypothetical protein ABI885_07690 [Gammaproteobacteria bacterium]
MLAVLAALGAGASPAWATEGLETSQNCHEVSQARARALGEEARRLGAHQRAAECYLAAGEPLEADQSFIKASLQNSVTTSQKLSTTVGDAKLQAARIRQAFRGK